MILRRPARDSANNDDHVEPPGQQRTTRSARERKDDEIWTDHDATRVLKENFSRQFAGTAITNLAIAGINLFTGLALARILGPERRGILAAIINWPIILAIFATVGLTEATAYYTAKRPDRAKEFYFVTVFICVPVSIALAGLGWILMPWLLSAQSGRTVTVSRWLLVFAPLATVVAVSEGCLRGLKRIVVWNVYRLIWPGAWLATVLAAALAHTRSPVFLAVGFAVTRGLGAIPVIIWFLWRLPGKARYSSPVAGRLVRYGAPGFFTLLPTVMNSRLDQLLLGGLVDPERLGLYVISVAWASISTLPALSLAMLILPRLASVSPSEQVSQLAESSRLGIFLAISTALPVLAATPLVLPLLFGDKFREAVPVAVILILAAVFTSWNLVIEDAARGLGSPKTVLYAEGLGLVATGCALFFLLGPFSLVGAAVASLLGYSVTSAVLFRFARRHSGLSGAALLLPRRKDTKTLSPRALWSQLHPTRPLRPKGDT